MTALLVIWTVKLAGGPQAGRSVNPPPPLARAKGMGRQQHILRTPSLSVKESGASESSIIYRSIAHLLSLIITPEWEE